MAVILAAALDNNIMRPVDVLQYATPEVLANHLPPDVMSSVLAASLSAGEMTPEVILRTAGPEVLTRFVPAGVLWTAIEQCAGRAEIPTGY